MRKYLSTGILGSIVGFSIMFSYQLGKNQEPEMYAWVLWFIAVLAVGFILALRDEINGGTYDR